MEIDDLIKSIFTIFIIGLLVVVLSIVAIQFGDATKDTTTAISLNSTVGANGSLLSTFDQVQVLSGCRDRSNETALTVDTTCNLTNAQLGIVFVEPSIIGAEVSLNFTYLSDSDASSMLDSLITSLGEIGDWFSILILVSVIVTVFGAIFLLTKMFGGMGR